MTSKAPIITVPTVLILGAGASMPYGFPSARGLLTDILRFFGKKDDEGVLALTAGNSDYNSEEFVIFSKALRLSGQASVDSFLELNPGFSKVGKAALAYCLIRYEEEGALFPRTSEPNLYQYIYGKLGANIEIFPNNSFSVLTFNYDRSFEHYLYTALRNSNTDASIDSAITAVKAIPVIHLYGRLSALPWSNEPPSRKYESKADLRNSEIASQKIKIMSETRDEDLSADKDFNRAWQLLDAAERICFLGFGYHERNLQRLRITNLDSKRQIWGSAMGMKVAEIKKVQSAIGDIQLLGADSLELLRQFGILD